MSAGGATQSRPNEEADNIHGPNGEYAVRNQISLVKKLPLLGNFIFDFARGITVGPM